MPFTKVKCSMCGQVAIATKQFDIAGETVSALQCGHILRKTQLRTASPEDVISLEHKKLYPFQCEGVRFAEKAGGRCIIADEMGLGKTVQANALIALHPELEPVAYFVKAGLKIQWQYSIATWGSKSEAEDDMALAQVIDSSKDKMLPGAKHYLFSFDVLRRFKNGSLAEQFKKRGIKTIIIDECQHIKNPESQRAKEVRELCKLVPNVLALSGTPIKNNAGEYFSILNILKPEMFPTYSKFLFNDCQTYYNGFGYKVGGLKNPEAFAEKTKGFIIRRERKDVMPELPEVDRRFHFDSLAEEVEDAYKATFKQFRDDYYSSSASFEESGNILAYLSKMRHLTGLSKIKPCVEFTEDFLRDTDRKLTIFVHHKDVGHILAMKIEHLCKENNWTPPLSLTADLNSEQRDEVVSSFMSEDEKAPRVLIASTLASGEGLNLQKCADCIVLERQWNPANEEQAEGRFIRIGQKSDSVLSTYFIAVGTVDEFFSKLVEEKREIVYKTLGSKGIVKWDQSSLMKELAEVLASQGGKQWGW